MKSEKRTAETQELIDVLIAISVVAKRLARKIENEGDVSSDNNISDV